VNGKNYAINYKDKKLKIESSLEIQVVKNVDIYPKEKSLYVGSEKEFSLEISHGSSFFDVTLGTIDITNRCEPQDSWFDKVSEFKHKGNSIKFAPKKTGSITICVTDLLLPDS
jgi:hypothetical protein